jgi:transcriptional regulator with XRE-family HTH domain
MYTIDIEKLATLVKTKIGDRGLCEVAEEIGTTPSTLSRISNFHPPKLETFLMFCEWLQIAPSEFIRSNGLGRTERAVYDNMTTAEKVEYLLRSDDDLEPDMIETLVVLVRGVLKTEVD